MYRTDLLLLACAAFAAAVASAPPLHEPAPRVTAANFWSAAPPSSQFAMTGLEPERNAFTP